MLPFCYTFASRDNTLLQAAVDIFTDDPSLEQRMWRFCGVKVGFALLQNHFAFRVSLMPRKRANPMNQRVSGGVIRSSETG